MSASKEIAIGNFETKPTDGISCSGVGHLENKRFSVLGDVGDKSFTGFEFNASEFVIDSAEGNIQRQFLKGFANRGFGTEYNLTKKICDTAKGELASILDVGDFAE
jgi:hypothetical protein